LAAKISGIAQQSGKNKTRNENPYLQKVKIQNGTRQWGVP